MTFEAVGTKTGTVTLNPAPGLQLPLALDRTYAVVSMFSGCGGMDLGFKGGFSIFQKVYERLPFDIIWANELNEAACRTYKKT